MRLIQNIDGTWHVATTKMACSYNRRYVTPSLLQRGHSLLGVIFMLASGACALGQDITVADALDCQSLQWACTTIHSNVARVITESTNTYDGVDAVAFLIQTDYGGSPLPFLTTTVVGPGTLTFWYQCANPRMLMNYSDTVFDQAPGGYITRHYGLVGDESGAWINATFLVEPGVHHLAWGFVVTQASQTTFLDQVKYVRDAAPPVIASQPQTQYGRLGTTVTFSATATSDSPMTYRWRKDGADLLDGGRLLGTDSPVLIISAIELSDVGNYSLVVSNEAGSTTSEETALLLNPSILASDSNLGFRSSVFGFTIVGRSGATAVVEGSTDLVNWLPLSTNVLGATPFYFSDPASATTPSRWYRIR